MLGNFSIHHMAMLAAKGRMKAREFWIFDEGGPAFECSVARFPVSHSIYVREVLPIDWRKVWWELQKWNGEIELLPAIKEKIEKLVESELSGDETP